MGTDGFDNPLDVHDPDHRVGRGLEQNQAGRLCKSLLDFLDIRGVNVLGLDALVLNELEKAIGSYFVGSILFYLCFMVEVRNNKHTSIDVIASNDLLACLQQPQDHIEGGHATADGVSEFRITNFGQMFL